MGEEINRVLRPWLWGSLKGPDPSPPPVACSGSAPSSLAQQGLDVQLPCWQPGLRAGCWTEAALTDCNLPESGGNVDDLLANAGEQCVLRFFLHQYL